MMIHRMVVFGGSQVKKHGGGVRYYYFASQKYDELRREKDPIVESVNDR